jgi:hypothetical protein
VQNVELQGRKYPLVLKYTEKNSTTEVKMQVFVVEKALNFSGKFMTDGIIGLGFNDDSFKSFTDSLAEVTGIPIFAVIIRSDYNENKNHSFIEFGAVSSSEGFLGKKRHKRVQDNVERWALVVTQLGLANLMVKGKNFGKFDINSGQVKVPKSLFNDTKEMLRMHFQVLDENLSADCDLLDLTSNDTFVFKVQRTKFPIRFRNLLEKDGKKCRLLFEESDDEEWVLGKPFFKDYFTVFDYEKKEVTFYQIENFSPGYYEVFIIVFAMIFPLISGTCGWVVTSKREDDEENDDFREKMQENDGKSKNFSESKLMKKIRFERKSSDQQDSMKESLLVSPSIN